MTIDATTTNTTDTMTKRERMLATLRGERADRVPMWMMRQAGRYLPQYHEVRNQYSFLDLCKTPEAAAEVTIQPLDELDVDALVIFNDILLPLEHAGADVDFDEKGPIIRNPPRSMEDFNQLTGHAVAGDEPVGDTIREVRRRAGEDVPILGFIGSPWTLCVYWVEGRVTKHFQNIASLRHADPEFIEQLLETITPIAIDYLKVQIEAGADAVQLFDSWGSILGANEYHQFSGKYLKQIIDAIKPTGTPVILYLNGIAPYLEQVAELGADCVSVDWRVDLKHARKVLGPDTVIQGNVDPMALVAGPEATTRAVKAMFEQLPAGPGHVANLGHGILPMTPVASAKAFVDGVKQYGRY